MGIKLQQPAIFGLQVAVKGANLGLIGADLANIGPKMTFLDAKSKFRDQFEGNFRRGPNLEADNKLRLSNHWRVPEIDHKGSPKFLDIPQAAKIVLEKRTRQTGLEHMIYLRRDGSWSIDGGHVDQVLFEPLGDYDPLEREFFGIPAAHSHPRGQSAFPSLQDLYELSLVAFREKSAQHHSVFGFVRNEFVEIQIVANFQEGKGVTFSFNLSAEGLSKAEGYEVLLQMAEFVQKYPPNQEFQRFQMIAMAASLSGRQNRLISQIMRTDVICEVPVLIGLNGMPAEELNDILKLCILAKRLCLPCDYRTQINAIILNPTLSLDAKEKILIELKKPADYFDGEASINLELMDAVRMVLSGIESGFLCERDLDFIFSKRLCTVAEWEKLKSDLSDYLLAVSQLQNFAIPNVFKDRLIKICESQKIGYLAKLKIVSTAVSFESLEGEKSLIVSKIDEEFIGFVSTLVADVRFTEKDLLYVAESYNHISLQEIQAQIQEYYGAYVVLNAMAFDPDVRDDLDKILLSEDFTFVVKTEVLKAMCSADTDFSFGLDFKGEIYKQRLNLFAQIVQDNLYLTKNQLLSMLVRRKNCVD